MEIGDKVRIIVPPDGFYDTVTTNGPDPYTIGGEGTIVEFGCNSGFDTGWMVQLAQKATPHFFHEEELIIIDEIGGALLTIIKKKDGSKTTYTPDEIKALPRPPWWDDDEKIKFMLFQVEVEGETIANLFAPFLTTENEVRQHLKKLIQGDKQ